MCPGALYRGSFRGILLLLGADRRDRRIKSPSVSPVLKDTILFIIAGCSLLRSSLHPGFTIFGNQDCMAGDR